VFNNSVFPLMTCRWRLDAIAAGHRGANGQNQNENR